MGKTSDRSIFATIIYILRGILTAVSFSALSWITALVISYAGWNLDNPTMRLIVAAVWAVVVLAVTLLSKQKITDCFRFRIKSDKKINAGQKGITFALALFFGIALNRVITVILKFLPVPESALEANNENVSEATESTNIFIIILAVWIIAPLVEELIFRGKAFWYFEKAAGKTVAVIVTSVIFAVCHGNILQGAYAFVCALFCCIFVEFADSVAAGIFLHMGFNASNLILAAFVKTQNSTALAAVDIISVIVLLLAIISAYFVSRLNIEAEEEEYSEDSIYIDGDKN